MAVVLLANVFFGGGGKCPNLGVVNVRILGVGNVRLANNLTPKKLRIVVVRLLFKVTMQVNAFDSEQECLVHMLLHNFTEKRFPPDFATN